LFKIKVTTGEGQWDGERKRERKRERKSEKPRRKSREKDAIKGSSRRKRAATPSLATYSALGRF
jgi:hypothetical protein